MGKYMRKCKGNGEIAVVEVAQAGVRTRARALAMATASSGVVTRRKVGSGELKFSPSLAQLRSRRGIVVASEKSVSPSVSVDSRKRSVENFTSSSPSSDHIPASCCSSNGSSELPKERPEFADPEEEISLEYETSGNEIECRERREMTPSSELRAESGNPESTQNPSVANSERRVAEKMPSESEIEEFFAAAEKDLEKQFQEKYNFDFRKGEPLEGRYVWVEATNH